MSRKTGQSHSSQFATCADTVRAKAAKIALALNLEIGDVVRLQSGGQRMTVIKAPYMNAHDGVMMVQVLWFEVDRMRRASLPAATLVLDVALF